MRLYICIDGSFAGTQADAKAKGNGFTEVDVPTDKAGLIDYLNGMVDEARGLTTDRAADMAFGPIPTAPKPAAAPPSYADQSVAIDDAWDALPLARKLHFAALAMEDARAQI